MLIGEQPGDIEDQKGEPFVGPAGRMLDRALEDAQISRDEVYVTNAVKHFKWIWRGKRRRVDEFAPFFHDRYRFTNNRLCGGSTHTDENMRLQCLYFDLEPWPECSNLANRRLLMQALGKLTFVTIHPSAILRQRDKDEREEEYRRFASEMKLVKRKLQSLSAA